MTTRRGWCPSLYDPMQTGDGLLVRVKPPGARLPSPAAHALADAAAQWGNGTIELTRRGNLQLRGLRPNGVVPFAAAMAAAGLADPDPARERRRITIAPALAGDDPGALADNLAERLDAELPTMPSKFSIAVNAGGILSTLPLRADVVLHPGTTLEEAMHLCSLSLRERVGVREAASTSLSPDRTVAPENPGSARVASLTPTLSRRERGPAQSSIAGFHSYRGTTYGALALALPLGQIDAPALHALAALADGFGGSLRTSPWRVFLLGRVEAADLPAVSRAAQAAGFATDPADLRLHVTSCIGAPGCASATVPARQDAARLAREGRGPLHVSGCAKGCAFPGGVPALVGAAGHYTFLPDWQPGQDPAP